MSSRNPFSYEKFEQIDRDSVTAWLTLDEIAQQINLVGDESQDSYLESLELAVRQHIEDYLGLSIFSATYRVYYGAGNADYSPCNLDLPEVSQNTTPSLAGITITSVGYWDSSNTFQTLSSGSYYYDASGNKIVITSGLGSVNTQRTSPIVVVYATAASPIAGYSVVKQAGLLLFTHLYNNRADATELNLKRIPFGVDALLRPYKPLVL